MKHAKYLVLMSSLASACIVTAAGPAVADRGFWVKRTPRGDVAGRRHA
jgi:hypothetical protein